MKDGGEWQLFSTTDETSSWELHENSTSATWRPNETVTPL